MEFNPEPLIQGAFTLLTVVITFLLTFFTTRASERERWSREYDTRWDAKRLQALTEYGAATKRVLTLSWDVAKSRGLGTSIAPTPIGAGGPLIDEAETARGNKFEAVLLLVSSRTRRRAAEWHQFCWGFIRIAKGEIDLSPEQFLEYRDLCFTARDRFYESAREELGVQDSFSDEVEKKNWMDSPAYDYLEQLEGRDSSG